MNVQALREVIASERLRFEVAGVAVAIVKDGEVILAEGFGLADLASGRTMTADTHLPIASDTKAFTAAALCQLADEGLLDLDAPVRDVVPWFELSDPHATALVSARDLLSHRTGLPRHDLMWIGRTGHTNESIARSLKHLEMSRQLRTTWQYNNLAYVTAGYLTEVVTGEAWADAVTNRLLTPAGMKNTFFDVSDIDPGNLATPYKRIDGVDTVMPLPLSRDGSPGPAGRIISTVNDMSQWLLTRLGDRPEVLSAAALAQLHAPAMIGSATRGNFSERQSLGYALGCQVEAYRGVRVVNHGGNLLGYCSMVTVVPEHNLGIVVLTNGNGSPLRDVIPLAVIDRLLDLEPLDWGSRLRELQLATLGGAAVAREHHKTSVAGLPPSRPLSEFAGTYTHPAYGRFGVAVSEDGSTLVPDFHGLGDAHGLRHRSGDAWDLLLHDYDLTGPMVFTQGVDGRVDGLGIALEPLVAPVPFERQPDALDPQLRAAMIGAYEMGPLTLTVRARGEQLVADAPGVGTVTLVHTGGARFGTVELPAAVIDVEFTAGVGVTRFIVDPLGIFTPAEG